MCGQTKIKGCNKTIIDSRTAIDSREEKDTVENAEHSEFIHRENIKSGLYRAYQCALSRRRCAVSRPSVKFTIDKSCVCKHLQERPLPNGTGDSIRPCAFFLWNAVLQ